MNCRWCLWIRRLDRIYALLTVAMLLSFGFRWLICNFPSLRWIEWRYKAAPKILWRLANVLLAAGGLVLIPLALLIGFHPDRGGDDDEPARDPLPVPGRSKPIPVAPAPADVGPKVPDYMPVNLN